MQSHVYDVNIHDRPQIYCLQGRLLGQLGALHIYIKPDFIVPLQCPPYMTYVIAQELLP